MALLTREQILDAELSPGKARLNRIARCLREQVELSDDDRTFLANALQGIVDGSDPKVVLGVKGAQSEGRKPMTAREADVWFQHVFRVEQIRSDERVKLELALERVAEERHVARDSLVRYHKKYRRQAVVFLEMIQQEMRLRARVKKWFDC